LYVDVTLTRSKVKVTVLLNFRQLAKLCMLAAMTAAPCGAFWFFVYSNKISYRPVRSLREIDVLVQKSAV